MTRRVQLVAAILILVIMIIMLLDGLRPWNAVGREFIVCRAMLNEGREIVVKQWRGEEAVSGYMVTVEILDEKSPVKRWYLIAYDVFYWRQCKLMVSPDKKYVTIMKGNDIYSVVNCDENTIIARGGFWDTLYKGDSVRNGNR